MSKGLGCAGVVGRRGESDGTGAGRGMQEGRGRE